MTSITKVCSKCKTEKPLSEFHRDRSSKDGHHSWCKACKRKWYRDNRDCWAKWYRKNREVVIARSRKWYRDNSDRAIASSARWYRENHEYALARNAQWQRDNPEKVTANRAKRYQKNREYAISNPERRKKWCKDYRDANKEKIAIRERQTRLEVNGKKITIKKRIYPNFCELCGKEQPKKLNYHHWDDNNPHFGMWICVRCHTFAEKLEEGIKPEAYFALKEKIENE